MLLNKKLNQSAATAGVHSVHNPFELELSKCVFVFRAVLLCLFCALVRGARLCRLRKDVFGHADGVWILLDVVLCADPTLQLPINADNHVRALLRSTQWSLFLFAGVPLFVTAAEKGKRGLAVLAVACMALQRSAAAMLTQNSIDVALALLALRPMWLVVSMVVGTQKVNDEATLRRLRRRGEHVV